MSAIFENELLSTRKAKCLHCGAVYDAMTLSGSIVAACCSDACTAAYRAKLFPETVKLVTTQGGSGWRKICPPRYAQFDRSKLPKTGAAIVDRALAWDARNATRGLAIIGPSDGGKSMILHEVARLAFESGYDVHVVSSSGFAFAVGSLDGNERREAIKRAISCAILLIDDVGKEKMTERVEADFYHVLEERERWGRLLLFTANAKGGQLERGMSEDRGAPIVNRLRRMVDVITI